jgi:hypothetical protein
MIDFRSDADKRVCGMCIRKFGQHPDCNKCERDAEARFAQHRWWDGQPSFLFLGVNVGQCLSHPARGYVLGHLRLERPVDET